MRVHLLRPESGPDLPELQRRERLRSQIPALLPPVLEHVYSHQGKKGKLRLQSAFRKQNKTSLFLPQYMHFFCFGPKSIIPKREVDLVSVISDDPHLPQNLSCLPSLFPHFAQTFMSCTPIFSYIFFQMRFHLTIHSLNIILYVAKIVK